MVVKNRALSSLALSFAMTVAPGTRTLAQEEGFRVIVHKENPTTTLSKTQVSEYLLKRVSRWDHGVSVEPVDLEAGSGVREPLSRAVHGRSVSSIKDNRERQIFSGDGVPPPESASEAEVVAFVRSHPGAIGYVSSRARLDGVKVLSVRDR